VTGVNLKLVKHGGPVAAARLGRLARRRRLALMAGAMVETRVGLAAMLHVVRALTPWGTPPPAIDLDTALLLAEDPFVGGYVVANLLFALVYTLLPDAIHGSTGFVDNFFFSVQTWATIGYGGMTPKTMAANIVVVAESMIGIFGVALLTGLLFAKFSRPTSQILFADAAVVASYGGRPTLMIRVANERHSTIADSTAHVTLLRRNEHGGGVEGPQPPHRVDVRPEPPQLLHRVRVPAPRRPPHRRPGRASPRTDARHGASRARSRA
jgi:hypothetical protein